MRKLLTLPLAFVLAACTAQDPTEVKSTDNPNVPVGVLLEIDGCKVYRFKDAGNYVYFTNCVGKTTAFHSESCGKNCRRDVPVTVETELVP